LVIFTFFFSSILAGGSTKRTFYRSSFVIACSGLAVGAAFALAAPLFPGSIPIMDIGVVSTVITWVSLVRYYCEMGWLESFVPAFIAAIIYVMIIAIASGFSILLLSG
jgi:hypothetical protein